MIEFGLSKNLSCLLSASQMSNMYVLGNLYRYFCSLHYNTFRIYRIICLFIVLYFILYFFQIHFNTYMYKHMKYL